MDFSDSEGLRKTGHRYDLDAILARLRDTAEQWVPRLFPNGRREGDNWRLANIKGDPPRKQDSCIITLKGERAGQWFDFGGAQGGPILNTLEKRTGLTGGALIAYAAELAGIRPTANPPPRPPRRRARCSDAAAAPSV